MPCACSACTSVGLNCAHGWAGPSELLTKTVLMPAAWARAAIALTSPPSLLGSCQIHIPLPANGAGSRPTATRRTGTGRTLRRMTFERRPARSVTRTEIVPALVPGGTRTTQPEGERRSFAASAPCDQRKRTRIPALKPRPRSWTCLPIITCGRGWHDGRDAGTQRRPVSFGGGVRASAGAEVTATATRPASAARRGHILCDNHPAGPKLRCDSQLRPGRAVEHRVRDDGERRRPRELVLGAPRVARDLRQRCNQHLADDHVVLGLRAVRDVPRAQCLELRHDRVEVAQRLAQQHERAEQHLLLALQIGALEERLDRGCGR